MEHVFFKNKIFAIFLLFCSLISNAYTDDACCGCWDLTGKAGIAPIVWRNRGCISTIECSTNDNGAPFNAFRDFVEIGKFSHFFKLPWTVGFEVGYWIDNCARGYFDFQYRQAKGKQFNLVIPVIAGSAAGDFRFNKYRTFSGYVGVDYLFDWLSCECFNTFLGIKVGFSHFRKFNLDGTLVLSDIPGVTEPSQLVDVCFGSHTVLSAGARVGIDYCFCECFSVLLMVEFLGQCSQNLNHRIINLTNLNTDIRFGGIGSEIVFPITLGLRYRF